MSTRLKPAVEKSRQLLKQRWGPWLWVQTRRGILIVAGALLSAIGYAIFQVPYNIAAGGVSGIGIIVNHYTGFSVSLFYLLVNIPLLIFGFFWLGGWRFLVTTLAAVAVFTYAIDAATALLPTYLGPLPITQDVFLSSVYAGVLMGIGEGLVYAAGATLGGTAILGRILQFRTGVPLSSVYLWVDGAIVVAAGLIFGWELAMYAMLTLLLSGLAADYALEGPSRARNAIIITTMPEPIIAALMTELERGVSHWEIVGGYTGEKRTLVFCTIYRPQVNDLKRIVSTIDPNAFVSIGVTQQVLGSGFTKLQA